MPQIIIDTTSVQYTDHGRGSVLVFIHGWLDSKETFNPLIKLLSQQYRCVAIDLPNFGASEDAKDCVTVEQYAEFIAQFLKKMQIRDYSLVGHSMGGQIAIYGVGEGILQPKKLTLIATAGVRDQRKTVKWLIGYLAKPFSFVVPRQVKNKVYKIIGSDYSADLSVIHKMIIKEVLSHDIQKQAQEIAVPTLLIYGELDQHTTVSMAAILHRCIKNSKLIVLSQYNHWVHQVAPAEVAKKMEDFIQ